MEKVRFVIIGLGMMGRQQCKRTVAHPRAELVEVVDFVKEKAEEVAQEFGCRFSTDPVEATSRDDVDAVMIVVPHYAHPEVAIAACENRKHIFCEKPLAVTVRQGDVMVDAVKNSGVVFGVDYQMRASEPTQMLRNLIRSGEMGKVHRVDMRYTSLRPEHYYRMGEWRGTWAGEGGGVTLNQGTHPIDVFQWIFGPPVELQASAQTYLHDIAVEDSASAMLRFEDGAHGYIHVSTCEYPDNFRFDIFCDKGHIIFDDSKLKIGRFDIAISEKLDDKDNWRPSNVDWEETDTGRIGWGDHDGMLDDFIGAVLDNHPPLSTAEDALRSLEITNAIILSSKKRKALRLPIDRDEYDELLADLVQQEREAKKS